LKETQAIGKKQQVSINKLINIKKQLISLEKDKILIQLWISAKILTNKRTKVKSNYVLSILDKLVITHLLNKPI
jgi:hypothetical protein